MIVNLEKFDYKFGDTLKASISGVKGWAAVLLKDPHYEGHVLRGSPVLLAQSGLPNNTPSALNMKLAWSEVMAKVVPSGKYALKVWGFDSANIQAESENLISIS